MLSSNPAGRLQVGGSPIPIIVGAQPAVPFHRLSATLQFYTVQKCHIATCMDAYNILLHNKQIFSPVVHLGFSAHWLGLALHNHVTETPVNVTMGSNNYEVQVILTID